MDDLDFSTAFGAPAPKTLVEEAWHTEQRRKQFDIIRVKNPTDEDFFVEYDTNQFQKIPANSEKDVPRHIAVRYLTHKTDTIINTMSQDKHDAELAERNKKGQPSFKNKYDENVETYERSDYPKLNDAKLRAEIMDQLWVGVVLESGRDVPPANGNPRSGEVDLTPMDVKIMEGLDRRRVPLQSTPATNQPLSAEEVTSE